MALNYVWLFFFFIAFIVALWRLVFEGDTEVFSRVMTSLFDGAKNGFDLSLGLTGIMTLWLGIMKIGERAGMIDRFAKAVSPFFRRLFPSIPQDHPAGGAIMMNFSANMLGLDNAATPLGLKAMQALQTINQKKDTASDAQIMFLVLNTAGLTIIPTSVIAMRQSIAIAQGVTHFNAADIFLPTLIVTFISFLSGMIAAAIYQRINLFRLPILLFVGGFAGIMAGLYFWLKQYPPDQMASYIGLLGSSIIFGIIILFLWAGVRKKLNVFETFIDGAKEGFQVVIKIIPYLVAMLIAIAVFRSTGCMDYIVMGLGKLFAAMGMNTDFVPTLPIGLMKPMSGAGSRGLMIDVMKTYGVNSFQGKLAAIIQGGTETTFYVLAVYFGSVGIKNTRYAIVCGLIADVVGLIAAIIVGYLFLT
jgi:spore maturation protein SpmA